MRELKEKSCSECGNLYQPTGSCSKYCPTCRPILTAKIGKAAIKRWQWANGYLNGKGSGSATGKGKENHMYKYGLANFQQYARERKETIGLCEECGKDIREATHYEWVGHHIDHNRKNNDISNLECLSRSDHMKIHCRNNLLSKRNDYPKGVGPKQARSAEVPEKECDIV